MKKSHWHTFTFILLSVIVLFGSFYPNIVEWYRTPPNTTYTFTFGHNGDFNLVQYFIKSGIEGHLLYKVPYTEQNIPPYLVHTIYFVSGLVLSPITKSPVVILYILRIVSLCIFLICLIKLIRTAFHRFSLQITAYILALTSTSIWSTSTDGATTAYTIPIPWNDTFYAFQKFIILPHHFLAIAAIMLLTLTMTRMPWTKRSAITASALTLALASFNPYHLLLIVFMTVLYGGMLWVYKPQLRKSVLRMTISILIPAAVMYGFYGVMYHHVHPWIQQQPLQALLHFHQSIPFSTYVLALGPTAFLSLLFLFPIFSRQVNRLFILIFLWALIPALIFQFADIGVLQPFKTHQYIPLALLTTAGIKYLVDRSKMFLVLIPIIIGGAILYVLPPYLATCRLANEEHFENYFNIYIPDYLTHTFTYLNKNTPNRSIVLAGEAVSIMMPTFTHNYVFIGQGDIVPDYNKRVMSVIDFFNQNMNPTDVQTFLASRRISYILFNIDAPAFTGNFTNYPFLKEVYHDGFSSVVQVIP